MVYLQNTTDTTNTKATNWSVAVTGMTVVHNAATTLPNLFGPFSIPFVGGSTFTYTGGEIVARFTTNAATQIDAVTVEFFSVSATSYRLVIRGDDGNGAPGALLYLDSTDRAVGAAGSTTLRLPSPVAVGPGHFFAGFRQTNTTNASFSSDLEFPVRAGEFFFTTQPDVDPWRDFSVVEFSFHTNIGVNLGSCLVPLTVDVTQNGTTSACAGGSILFTAIPGGGTGPYTYQWSENGFDIPGATGSTYTATKASAGSFSYNCKVTDSGGCSNVQDSAPSTGVWIANGSACNDGNGCTVNDTCSSGTCTGAPIFVPGEATGLMVQSDTQTLVWNSAGPPGSGTVHDVARGLVSGLPVGSSASETCLASGITPATTSDSTDPAIGDSFWYLVRGRNSCGTGTYGTRSNGTPRTTSVCP